MSGFTSHIMEAIKLNKERKEIYSLLSEGKTIPLSNTLILIEYFVIPIAWYFDLRGKKFNRQGIPILINDFQPMHVKDAKNSILHTNVITEIDLLEIHRKVRLLVSKLKSNLSLDKINAHCKDFHTWLSDYEKEKKVILPMTMHLVESICFISGNGIKYSKRSKGKTEKLTMDLVRLHFYGLRFSPKFDQRASKFHKLGIGIVANDLPTIKIS